MRSADLEARASSDVMSAGDRNAARFVVGDPVRGLAALGVFTLHVAVAALVHTGNVDVLRETNMGYGPLGPVLRGAGASALLFFALSGYLLSRPFLRAIVESAPLPSITSYVRRRLFRVVPAYWVVLTLVLLVYGGHGAPASHVAQAYALSLHWSQSRIPALAQAWTLNVELRFYLLLPLVCTVLAWASAVLGRGVRATSKVLVIVGLAVGCTAGALVISGGSNPFDDGGFLSALYAFMPGIVLAAVELLPLRRVLVASWVGPVATIVAVVATGLWLYPPLAPVGGALAARLWNAAVLFLLLGALLVHQWSGRRPWRVLNNSFTRWIGTRSYAFYLVHVAIIQAIAPRLPGGAIRLTALQLFPLALAATGFAAELLHRFVELPFMRLREITRLVTVRGSTPRARSREPA